MSASINRKCLLESEEVIRLYKDGKSTSEIAELAGVTAGSIRNILSKHDVEMRPRGSWKRKYSLNEDYFKMWTPNMAYILGFILADGTIAKGTQSVIIAQKETEILERIKNEFKTVQPLYKNEKTGVFLLNLNSKILKKDLIELHGVTSKKSLTIDFPDVPEEYMAHFIRGYFDGDGNIYSRGYMVSFVGGSLTFMEKLKEVFNKVGFDPYLVQKDKHVRLYISGRKTIKLFYEYIYNCSDIHLKRKFDLFPDKDLDAAELTDAPLKVNKKAVQDRKQKFIEAYRRLNSLDEACNFCGISKATYTRWIKEDKNFKDQL
ncbi:LAGLIDADG family homing endonuclease [Metabacillus indicus]|uniref:LAGLIDADG family homing endonuclease n=1 Tax=Metabacillus indicus TaxID=246786 RepID=UPI002491B159|nr:LAGLIDADG family homing endonuclease [Metabacillus indicus]